MTVFAKGSDLSLPFGCFHVNSQLLLLALISHIWFSRSNVYVQSRFIPSPERTDETMKKTLCLLFVSLIILSLFGGCKKETGEPEITLDQPVVVAPIPKPEPEQEFTLDPDVDLESSFTLPIPWERTESMTYEEFFSVERPFEYTNNYSFETGFYSNGRSGERADYILYFITKELEHFVINPDLGRITTLLGNHYSLIVVEETDAYRVLELNYEGSILRMLYESESEIDQFFADDDILMFRTGDSIIRIYLPTGDVDVLFQSEHVIDREYQFFKQNPDTLEWEADLTQRLNNWEFFYSPLSTTDIRWTKPPESVDEERSISINGLADTIPYFFSSLTNKSYRSLIYNFIEDYVIGYPDAIMSETFYDNDQYLYERGLDLWCMGIDPYTISYRTPDDDKYR